MIHLEPALVLPLMNHLMQQRLHRLVPTVPPNMAAADDDCGALTVGAAPRVMAEPAPHPARDVDRQRGQLAGELLLVELRMMPHQPPSQSFVRRVGALRRAPAAR